MNVLQSFRTGLIFFFKTIEKHFYEFSCVCNICVKWYYCSDKYIKMCIYAYIFGYAHVCMGMVHAFGMFIHMYTCLGSKILSHIHIKRTYVYAHGCVYPCVDLYISICISEDLDI